jgi:putative ABC transport system ATP-binding protein
MLGCILRPTEGEVVINGERVWELDERRLPMVRRRDVGFIVQTFNLFSALTAAENVEFVLNMKGIRGPTARRELTRLLDLVGSPIERASCRVTSPEGRSSGCPSPGPWPEILP